MNNINIEELTEYYMFANTPMYLYRHFKEDDSVQKLASKFGAEEIYNKYNAIALKEEKTLIDAVLSYTYLIALGLKEYSESAVYIRQIKAYNLDWVDTIRDIIISTAKVNNRFSIPIPKTQQIYKGSSSSPVKLTRLTV